MRVVFHVISTGGGAGASRTTRYIAERDKDPEREGPGPRPLFSEDRDNLTYRSADRILDRLEGQPDKDDLLHISVSFQEEDFQKLGKNEEDRQAALRRAVREGMRGVADELNVEWLTWIAGIHRNTDNPHAHIVILNEATERQGLEERDFSRLRTSLLPHKQMVDGEEVRVPGRIGDRFLAALDKHQQRFRDRESASRSREEIWDEFTERVQRESKESTETMERPFAPRDDKLTRQFKGRGLHSGSIDYPSIQTSWNKYSASRPEEETDYRIALGRHLALSIRLAFAEVWHDRAVTHGDTYRFEVIDQSLGEERKLSELDVHRRASARAQRFGNFDRAVREEAFDADLSRHRETLDQLLEAQEAKIAALGKDVGSLRATVSTVARGLSHRYDTPNGRVTPIMSRETLSELQNTAIRLNLPEHASTLEELRLGLAKEFRAALRTDEEAAALLGHLNVTRADYLARNVRVENFETSLHLTPYEVHGERWSLSALDKQLARRREDAKVVPERAVRLNVRAITRMNFLPGPREQAAKDVEHLTFLRGEIVREIQQRRQPLINERERSRDLLEVLDDAFLREKSVRDRSGVDLPEPKYELHHMRSLESSAETLRDTKLLTEVHSWERNQANHSNEFDWQGRAVAREVMAGVAVEETKQRLQQFLEIKQVASLNLGDHRTSSLKEVETRGLTDYLVRLLESNAQRDRRHSINLAAREHHGRLVSDFEKARDYHSAAHELASDAAGREPKFTDKEKMNLEIYAERQNDDMTRERYLGLAREQTAERQQEAAASHSR